MINDRWLLPEGIDEILPEQARRLERLRRELLDQFDAWGYEMVFPPMIEYLDSLLTGTGNDLDLQTFKLIDQLTGRLMGVRADMTPQVARIDAHRLPGDGPRRLCYIGAVLHTRPETHGGSRSPIQLGAELYGHAGIESDVEVLRLMASTLQRAGFDSLHLDLGHVGIFRGLARQANLDSAAEAALFDALQRKAVPEVTELTAGLGEVGAMLAALPRLNGPAAVLDEAATTLAAASEAVRDALGQLREVAAALGEQSGVELNFDLAELRGYHYHTGLVYAAYAPGRSQALAQGGRYDEIGKVFGRARPATGFSMDLRAALELPQNDTQAALRGIFVPWNEERTGLDEAVAELRAAGERVVQGLPGQNDTAGCERRLLAKGGGWEVVPL